MCFGISASSELGTCRTGRTSRTRWLAAEFLRRVDQGEDMRPFFGSWFDLRGKKQTGYFLGHELIARLQQRMSLRDVALLTDIESHLRPLLIQMED